MILNTNKYPTADKVIMLLADINYTNIITNEGCKLSSYTLKKVKNELYPKFLRVNKSVAVNIDFATIEKDFVKVNNQKFYFSRRRKK